MATSFQRLQGSRKLNVPWAKYVLPPLYTGPDEAKKHLGQDLHWLPQFCFYRYLRVFPLILLVDMGSSVVALAAVAVNVAATSANARETAHALR